MTPVHDSNRCSVAHDGKDKMNLFIYVTLNYQVTDLNENLPRHLFYTRHEVYRLSVWPMHAVKKDIDCRCTCSPTLEKFQATRPNVGNYVWIWTYSAIYPREIQPVTTLFYFLLQSHLDGQTASELK